MNSCRLKIFHSLAFPSYSHCGQFTIRLPIADGIGFAGFLGWVVGWSAWGWGAALWQKDMKREIPWVYCLVLVDIVAIVQIPFPKERLKKFDKSCSFTPAHLFHCEGDGRSQSEGSGTRCWGAEPRTFHWAKVMRSIYGLQVNSQLANNWC